MIKNDVHRIKSSPKIIIPLQIGKEIALLSRLKHLKSVALIKKIFGYIDWLIDRLQKLKSERCAY